MPAINPDSNTHASNISLLDFIQKQASIGTWEFDINLMSLHWSKETKHIHDVSEKFKPTVELGISFYKEGYSRNTITKLFSNCIENHKSFDTELQIVTAKGNDKWVRAIGKPIIEDGNCIKVQGLFQDIDEKTKNSKALAFKEEQLRKTFETAVVGMAILDLNGQWIDVNKSLCKTLGYTEDELQRLSFMDITHPDDLMKGQKAMFYMINGKIDHFETEKRYINKEGKTIWTLLSVSIVKDSDGKPEHFVAQINDLTQLKKSSNKVTELLKTTENQNKRLLNFAHIVSHNLRSHYSNLDMLLDIVKMDLPETTTNNIFPLIEEAVSHLGETVENLNEVAAINIKNDIAIEPLNLLDSFNKVFSSITALIIESKTQVCVNINPKIKVMAIAAYLNSILLNFLTNAIKYKKPYEPAKIELHSVVTEDYIILKIKDHGLGIDLEKHGDKLFGMYKTFHNNRDSRGLGLFLTKNQVEAIGGKIEVESEVNKGTTFNIYFKKYE